MKLNVGEPDPANWPLVNRERGRLIDKSIARTITAGEAAVLAVLQWYADWYLERTKHPYDRACECLACRVQFRANVMALGWPDPGNPEAERRKP